MTRSDTTLGHKERTVVVPSGEVDHGPIVVSQVSQRSNKAATNMQNKK